MKIEWAPINVPLRRRLQTLSAAIFTIMVFGSTGVSYSITALILLFGNSYLKMVLLFYIAFIYYEHWKNFSAVSGLGLKFLRNNFLWKNLREYFPIELVKTCDLRPDRNYILCCYPHGIYSVSAMTNICLDVQPWLQLFPKIRPKLASVSIHFYTPFFREICRFSGGILVGKQSLLNHLCKSNDPIDPVNKDGFTSNAVAIVVGGAKEILYSRPGKYILILKNRKGFIKLALETGCPLVPVFTFGEVDIYDQDNSPPNSLIRKVQIFIKNLIGFPLPILIFGRGFFQYSFGVIPHRKRIVQVVGAPIEVTKSLNPTQEEIDDLHRNFIKDISDLFETHKAKYLKNSNDVKLEII